MVKSPTLHPVRSNYPSTHFVGGGGGPSMRHILNFSADLLQNVVPGAGGGGGTLYIFEISEKRAFQRCMDHGGGGGIPL